MMLPTLRAGVAITLLLVSVCAAAPEYCCRTLELGSKGALAVSEQKHIIGTYLHRDRDDGKRVYRQVENYQKYLYYMPEYSVRLPPIHYFASEQASDSRFSVPCSLPVQRWYVGDGAGVNAVYAWCLDESECATDLDRGAWEYFAYKSGGEWKSDPNITISCLD